MSLDDVLPRPAGVTPQRVNAAIILFCAVSITAIWVYTFHDIRFDRAEVIEHEFNENSNLALAFDEDTRRILKNAEYALWLIGNTYVRLGGNQEAQNTLQKEVDNGLIDTRILRFIAMIDAQGKMTLGTRGFKPVDVAAQEYFQFHVRDETDQMQVGRPLADKPGTGWTVPLSRRINKPDGSFAGVAYAALDIGYLNKLFEQTKLGDEGIAMLVGLDGITRARRTGHSNSAGEDVSKTNLLAARARNPVGYYMSQGKIDGVPRYLSYRTMTQYPLIIVVGSAQSETLAAANARERSYYMGAALLSTCIAMFGFLLITFLSRQKRAQQAVTDSERRFRSLIEHSSDLIVITDRDGTITYISPSIKPIAGYDAQETLGRNFIEFSHPDDVPAARSILAEIIGNPRTIHSAAGRFRHKDGSWLVFESKANNQLDEPMIAGVVINGRDVTVRVQAEQGLQRVNRTLKTLSACNGILIRSDNEVQLVKQMCENIVETGGYLLAWVGVVEHDDKKTVRPIGYAGYEEGFIENAQITWADTESGSGPAGKAIRTRKTHIIKDALTDPSFRMWQANATKLGYGSLVALPLISRDDVIGVLTLYAAGIDAFDAAELRLLEELAGDLAYGMVALRTSVAQRQSVKRLQRSMEGTILAMAATLEMRDAYTAGHQRRVAELAVAIAREMGWSGDDIHGLHLAAVVHDLGKIQIPAEILSKPSRLTPIEYELIKTHPGAGYNILKEVDFPWPIAQMVYQHHERLDGSGYPQELKGDAILPGAKILAVADSVEAMVSHRPYRPGRGIDDALGEILKNRGVAYDAASADACANLFRNKGFKFSE